MPKIPLEERIFGKNGFESQIQKEQERIDEEEEFDSGSEFVQKKGIWDAHEKALLAKYQDFYGNDWQQIARFIPTRTSEQIRSHVRKRQGQKQKDKELMKERKMALKQIEKGDLYTHLKRRSRRQDNDKREQKEKSMKQAEVKIEVKIEEKREQRERQRSRQKRKNKNQNNRSKSRENKMSQKQKNKRKTNKLKRVIQVQKASLQKIKEQGNQQ